MSRKTTANRRYRTAHARYLAHWKFIATILLGAATLLKVVEITARLSGRTVSDWVLRASFSLFCVGSAFFLLLPFE